MKRSPLPAVLALALTASFFYEGARASSKTTTKPAGTYIASFAPLPNMLHPMRIGLLTRASVVRAAVWQPGAVFVDNRPIFALKSGMVYSITPGRITEIATGVSAALPYDRRATLAAPDYRIWCNNRWWRGSIEIINLPGAVTAVNVLDLEDYLMGVVPSEMPSSWNIEALKAQAVAARSYAWAHHGAGSKWRSEGYDLKPDVSDQAYKGLAAEATSTSHAVRQTFGLILKDSDKLKAGFYRATVGSSHEENFNVRFVRVPTATLERISGIKNIVGVTVKQYDAAGNAIRLEFMGAKGSKEVSGISIARMLNFPTAAILDITDEGNVWKFTCRGPGNGARGLSQNGAQTLAQRGWKFWQILNQYYQSPGSTFRIDYIDGRPPMIFTPPPQPRAKPLGYSKDLIDRDKQKKEDAEPVQESTTPPVKDDTTFTP